MALQRDIIYFIGPYMSVEPSWRLIGSSDDESDP